MHVLIKCFVSLEEGKKLLMNDTLNTFSVKWDIWLLATQTKMQNTCCCYTSCGALAGVRSSSMGPTSGIDPMNYCTTNTLLCRRHDNIYTAY